jgi:hypothetical protein
MPAAQVAALRSVVSYLRYNVDNAMAVSDFTTGVNIPRDAYDGFLFGRSNAAAPQIHRWLSTHLETNDYEVQEWAYPMFVAAFPCHQKFLKSAASHLHDVFLKNSGLYDGISREHKLSELLKIYSGVYTIFRYAAHLDIPEDFEESRNELRANPYVVRAAMHIYREGEVACFRIIYRYSTDEAPAATEITGIVIPDRIGVCFLGLEDQSLYPMLVLATRRHASANQFFGVVLRRHREDSRILAGRVSFKKVQGLDGQTEEEAFKEECKKVGVRRASEFAEDLDNNTKHRIINDTSPLDGKTMLRGV